MATLDHWTKFLSAPCSITFPHLELIGFDASPPIVVGAGEVRIPSLHRFEFSLRGLPANVEYARSELLRQQSIRYESNERLRLIGRDAEGVKWSLGWTIPQHQEGEDAWTFQGQVDALLPNDCREDLPQEPSTEVIYVMPKSRYLPLDVHHLFPNSESGPSIYELDIFGSKLVFEYEAVARHLKITCPHSARLPATYTENWLGEPLRILFGQLIYPRLVARNLGRGRTVIFIRPTHPDIEQAAWAALWSGGYIRSFWHLYSQLLTFIASARDENDALMFESNELTRRYEEIIQASVGSRWVWALTFACGIEGLLKIMLPKGAKRDDVNHGSIEALIAHIKLWRGDSDLKKVAQDALRRVAEITPSRLLGSLQQSGVISESQLKAWRAVRNSVVHGRLLSIYSNETEDSQLLQLAAMTHALTREILRRYFAQEQAASASVKQEGLG